MKGKTLLCLVLVTLMLLSVFMIGSVSAQSTTIGVEPPSIIDLGLGPGSWFTVEIWIRGLTTACVGIEFKLGYDTNVLTATGITYGGAFDTPPGYIPLISVINDADGYLHYSVMDGFDQPGFTGDGRAAVINFTVDSVGQSVLDLYGTKLGDASPIPVPIDHEALDGYFINALLSVTLARRSAWPEHHHYRHYSTSPEWDEDDSNDLFAIVKNDGDVDTWVKVVFNVTGSNGIPIDYGLFNTTTMLLPAGAIYGHKATDRFNATFVPPQLDKYYVTAQCWADTNADTVPDTPMGKKKTFSFNVVP